MSKPHPPKPAAAAPKTCAGCRHWHAGQAVGGETAGECRQGPPDVLMKVGPVMMYRQTLETLPACGAFAAR